MEAPPRYTPILKPTPRVLVKAAQAKTRKSQWQRTCEQVDARDKRRCMVTGATLTAGHVDPWKALERHHFVYRSRSKANAYNASNVGTVCRAVHQLIHTGALEVVSKNALVPMQVRWNRAIVPVGKEPFRSKSTRPA